MTALGLQLVDWLVIIAYFIGMVAIGFWARKRIKNTSDFYQGGRSFGKWLMMFLNFGSLTDAGQTAAVTSEVYRQGLQGVWIQNLVLFHTPFQWFISALQRRARYLAPGDMFLHRFESRFLAGLYAAVLIAVAIYSNSFGYLLTGKTLQAIMVKPESEYTQVDKESVAGFKELQSLKTLDYATLKAEQKSRLAELQEMERVGTIRSFASYIDLTTFYVFYAILIAAYTALGGLFAVALIDIVQGVLIVFLSLALIPQALAQIGGLEALRTHVPERMFELFGSSAASEYTWYFVASFALLNLVANAPKSFMIGGAAKDDMAARIGFVTGSVFKRFMMIAWAITGILAIGLYSGQVSDPTNIWGYMTRNLLGPGAIGLMIAAVFSANMDGNSTISLETSAAVVKNIIEPLRPGLSERVQMMLSRLLLLTILVVSIFFARKLQDLSLVAVFKYILSVLTIIGPSFWLVYFWRKLNTRAVVGQMVLSIILTIALPNIIPSTRAASSTELTQQTTERTVQTTVHATRDDVKGGKATSIGQVIQRQELIPASGIFFEAVGHTDPHDTSSALKGTGLFRPQIWILSKLGIDFRTWTKSGVSTAAFLFDSIVPFLVLIILSLFTRRNSEVVLRDFYARVHTPAVADPDLDAQLVREKIENPALVENDKIFPGSDWEFWKPTRVDIIGFFACIGFVLAIIGLYMLVASVGTA